jgi:hypothetical protein
VRRCGIVGEETHGRREMAGAEELVNVKSW